MSEHKNQSFLRRLGFATSGLAAAWRTEASLRWQVLALVPVVVLAVLLRLEPIWWALLALASALVFCAELFNTAIEHLADHLHPQLHPQIKVVKDCAAAAVLMTSAGALGVGIAAVVHVLNR